MVGRKVVRPATRRVRRLKRSFSLSEEALAYLASVSANYNSQSEALDALIRQKKRDSERAQIAAAVTNYYDSISEIEVESDRAWGHFAETQLPED